MLDLMPIESKLEMPPELEGSRLLVGWSMELEHARQPIGFSFGDPELNPATGYIDPILMEDEGHLMTIAPTGAGKGRGCIIPALLRYDGPVIVIDPKGENALVTARRRRELGQQVAVIDPIGITGLDSTPLNPLDLLDAGSPTLVDDAMAVISTMIDPRHGRNTSDGDYWSERGATFVLGIVLHVVSDLPDGRRHLGTVRELVAQAMGEVAVYSNMTEREEMRGRRAPPDTVLGRLERSRNAEAARIGQMLRLGAVSTLGGILSFSQSIVEIARGDAITQSLASTGFDLAGITRGDPISIYLVLPPHMLDSHAKLIRLWVHTLMTLITRRNARPKHSTLFILDEASQLGTFNPLRRAITLMRGYGMQTWSFWQDPSQLVNLYPNDWQTMVNNCRAVQCFGANTMLAAEAMSGIVGFRPADRLLDLADHEMLLQLKGDAPIVARLPDYRQDPAFTGMYDENPFHDPDRPVIRPVIERVVVRQKAAEPGAEGETVEVLPAQDLVAALRRRRQPKAPAKEPPAKETPELFPEDAPEPDTPSAETPPPENPPEE